MIRSIIAIVALIAATLWLPLWVQLVFYILAVIAIPYRFLLYIPAVIADVLYAPTGMVSPANIKTILFVSLLVTVHWLVVSKTRLQYLYGVETQ